jgi:hypothetical protein
MRKLAGHFTQTTHMTFHDLGLDESILKSIDEFGFTTPTPIQAGAIPHILEGKDVIGSAQTWHWQNRSLCATDPTSPRWPQEGCPASLSRAGTDA